MAHALYFQGGGLISLGFRWADLMARLFAGEDRLEDAERFLKERSSTWSKEAVAAVVPLVPLHPNVRTIW